MAVLLNLVQPTKESLYGDIPDLDVEKATVSKSHEIEKSGRTLCRRNVANRSMGTLHIKKKKKSTPAGVRAVDVAHALITL